MSLIKQLKDCEDLLADLKNKTKISSGNYGLEIKADGKILFGEVSSCGYINYGHCIPLQDFLNIVEKFLKVKAGL